MGMHKQKYKTRIISLSKPISELFFEQKKDLEKNFPTPILLKDYQFLEILLNVYIENKEKKWNLYLEQF